MLARFVLAKVSFVISLHGGAELKVLLAGLVLSGSTVAGTITDALMIELMSVNHAPSDLTEPSVDGRDSLVVMNVPLSLTEALPVASMENALSILQEDFSIKNQWVESSTVLSVSHLRSDHVARLPPSPTTALFGIGLIVLGVTRWRYNNGV